MRKRYLVDIKQIKKGSYKPIWKWQRGFKLVKSFWKCMFGDISCWIYAHTLWPAIQMEEIYPTEVSTQKTHLRMLILAQLVIVKWGNSPNGYNSRMGKQIVLYTYTIYYSAMKPTTATCKSMHVSYKYKVDQEKAGTIL